MTRYKLPELWEDYVDANDPRLFKELNRLVSLNRLTYEDALNYAATEGRLAAAISLMEHGVAATTMSLTLAAYNGQLEMMHLLLAHGANVNEVVPLSWVARTPLMVAVGCANVEAVRILMDAGAQLDAVNEDGHTALAFVYASVHREITSLLIESGMDVKGKQLTELLARPLTEVHPDILEMLRIAGCQ